MTLWKLVLLVLPALDSAETRQSAASCADSELDALELAEGEQQLPENLQLLQLQTSLQQLQVNASVLETHAAANATSSANRGRSLSGRRFDPHPLGIYTATLGAPDIYWAVASLCFAAFVTCGALVLGSWFFCRNYYKEEYRPSLGYKVLVGLFLAIVVAGAFYLAVWYFAGAILKKWLMAYDTSFLGVEVYVDRIALNPFAGTVRIQNLTVGNPDGYTSDHLAKVNELYVDVNMGDTVKSLGHRLSLDHTHVNGVSLVYEQALTTSNVEDVLNHLGVIQQESSTKEPSTGFQVDLHVHEVSAGDMWVRAKFALPGTSGILTQVPNISWADFDAEVKPNSTDEVVIIVSATILQNARRLFGR